MPKKLLLMFNPSSGKSQIKTELWNVIDIFVKGETAAAAGAQRRT